MSHYCRALPGLPSLLALPKSKQKASAKFLGDLSTACRLKVTNGLSPRPFLRRLHWTGARLRNQCASADAIVRQSPFENKICVSQRHKLHGRAPVRRERLKNENVFELIRQFGLYKPRSEFFRLAVSTANGSAFEAGR
ncbi:hypothetical protein [uncultured Dysgonomonas sp.]|uniref:hypothetical protein n=1 Tax=uncultured Dysgonomonas sp. TaxID=206096 RepID=UPI0025DCBC6A|nr:hypothetical protein [uncultured Dysgonomonas sp.]